jgi:hypothetical protein
MNTPRKPATIVRLTATDVTASRSTRVRSGVRAGALTIKQKVTEN